MRVWFEGKLHQGPLGLSPLDRGLTLGDGIFETLLVQQGVALWRFEHLQRMAAAAAELAIAFPQDAIENAIDGLCHTTKTTQVLRLTLSRGEGGRGLAAQSKLPTLIATLDRFDERLQFQPLTLITSNISRNENSPLSRMKTLSYLEQVMAAREALSQQADDALMLNSRARVACSTIGNVFLWLEDVLVTPSLSEGVLPGVMRGAVLKTAADLGIKTRQRQVRASELALASAVYVTNSLRYVRQVTHIDRQRFSAKANPKMNAIVENLLRMTQEQIVLS